MGSSLLAGVSGLQANQQMLDVVGNNLANLNTTGFKTQKADFADLVYGGTEPMQIGTGVIPNYVGTDFQQGALQSTGNNLDLAIQGNGFFVVNDGSQDLYTRAGSFGVDKNNYLVDPSTGARVQRYGNVGEATATTPAFQTPGDNDITIPYGMTIPGRATTEITLQGNLDATASGPTATVLTSGSAFTSGGQPATASTDLNALDSNTTPYQSGDQILISGTDANGNTVNATFDPTATSTLNDLVTAINGAFTGATASIDSSGNLVLTANNTGTANLSLALSDASTNTGQTNWNSHAMAITTAGQAGSTLPTAIQVYDSQGAAHTVSLVFQKVGSNTWNLTASMNPQDGTMITSQVNGIKFNPDGSFSQVTGNTQISFMVAGLAQPQAVNLEFGPTNGFSGVTQFGATSSAAAVAQDGYGSGVLKSVAVSQDGTITGTFSNGQALSIAQIATATFANPEGLNRQGSNYYAVTNDSGIAHVGTPDSADRGYLQEGVLEQSNVDVSLEFTNLITAEQGYEANSRTIRVSDEMLQDLNSIIT